MPLQKHPSNPDASGAEALLEPEKLHLHLLKHAHTAGPVPYLDIQQSLGADGSSAGSYGKFARLEVTVSSLPPGEAGVVRDLDKTGHAGGSRAIPRNAEVERHGHQGGVTEATRQGARKAYETTQTQTYAPDIPWFPA